MTTVPAGTIGAWVAPKNSAQSINYTQLQLVADALQIPIAHFTTTDPREYTRAYLDSMTPDELAVFMSENKEVHKRAQWCLQELQLEFGDEFRLESVAAHNDMDPDDLKAQLEGVYEMPQGTVDFLAALTGAGGWLSRPQDHIPPHLRPAYELVSAKAYRHSVMPETLDSVVEYLGGVRRKTQKGGGN